MCLVCISSGILVVSAMHSSLLRDSCALVSICNVAVCLWCSVFIECIYTGLFGSVRCSMNHSGWLARDKRCIGYIKLPSLR